MRGGLKETLTTCVTYTVEDSIKRSASIKKDFTLLGKIAGVDMVAKEARYHEFCRREYIRDYERPHHRDDGNVQDDLFYGSKEQRAAYDEAFTYISDGNLVVDWISGEIMPQQIVDILATPKVGSSNIRVDDDVEECHNEVVEEDDEVDNILNVIFEDDMD